MNLNTFLARSGVCSRRKAAEYIKEGRVSVNKATVLEPWRQVASGDAVAVDGKKISSEKHIYLVLNKPKGVTTTVEDKFASKKVTDMVPRRYGRLYPVGRLDKDTRGLLILTNDGDLCYKLTHPKFGVEKEYAVAVKGRADESKLKALVRGVEDEGEVLRVKSYSIAKTTDIYTEIRVIASEGKKRHIRRMFKRLGFEVTDLERIRIGRLTMGELREGKFRVLDRDTVYKLTVGTKEARSYAVKRADDKRCDNGPA